MENKLWKKHEEASLFKGWICLKSETGTISVGMKSCSFQAGSCCSVWSVGSFTLADWLLGCLVAWALLSTDGFKGFVSGNCCLSPSNMRSSCQFSLQSIQRIPGVQSCIALVHLSHVFDRAIARSDVSQRLGWDTPLGCWKWNTSNLDRPFQHFHKETR